MVKKKKASKRLSMKFKKGMAKKVAHHHRKLRKLAKFAPKHKSRDPGVPNFWPFKDQVLQEVEDIRQKATQEKEAQKERQRREAKKRRQEEARMLGQGQFAAAEEAPAPERTIKDASQKPFTLGDIRLKKSASQKRNWYYENLKEVIDRSDVIVQVLDARDPMGSRSLDIENAVQANRNKRLIVVLNKCDLVPAAIVAEWVQYFSVLFPVVAFKAFTPPKRKKLAKVDKREGRREDQEVQKTCTGARQLMSLMISAQGILEKKNIVAGIVGFPNVGKSSIINSIKRNQVCPVSHVPGLTQELAYIKLDKRLSLVDTSGVLFSSNDDSTAMLRNCVRMESLEDVAHAVSPVVENFPPEALMQLYRLPRYEGTRDFLQLLARKVGKLGRGGVPNLKLAARHLVEEWKLPFYAQPPEEKAPVSAATLWTQEFDLQEFEEQTAASLRELEEAERARPSCEYIAVASGGPCPAVEDDMDEDDEDEDEDEDEEKDMEDEEEEEEEEQVEEEKVVIPVTRSNKKKQKQKKQQKQPKRTTRSSSTVAATSSSSSDAYDFGTDWN